MDGGDDGVAIQMTPVRRSTRKHKGARSRVVCGVCGTWANDMCKTWTRHLGILLPYM